MCWCDPQKRTPWCDNCRDRFTGKMKLETIYDLLKREDGDFRVSFEQKYLKYDGKTYRVFLRNMYIPSEPILLIETPSEGMAVGVLSGHYQAL
jgi:hypothetical protein